MFKPQLKSPLRNSIMRALLAGNSTPSVPSFYFNFSNPSNVTLGAAQARGTITSTQNAVIAASVSPSRTTGVAPLYVNFDATGTTSTLSTNPSHELFFAADFGDTGAGTWANGVQSSGLTSKNAGYGPVTGHVYETPGTYTVQMVVTDGVNTATKTGTIVVQDPNTVYAGTDTICISHSGNFAGKPTGAQEVNTAGNTNMYAAWVGIAVKTGKRILFCKSDAWTCSAPMLMAGLSGVTVSGYGTGAARSVKFGTTTDTLVPVTLAMGATSLFECGGSTDCRVSSFKITAMATNGGMFVSSAGSVSLTYCKIEVRGASAGFSSRADGNHASFQIHDQHCIYECLNDEVYGYVGVDLYSFTGATASNGGGVTPCVFTATGHKFQRFNTVRITGTPPTGFSNGVNYYVSASNLTANTFSLSSTYTTDTPVASSSTGTCDVTNVGLSGGISAFVGLSRGGMMGCYLDSCNHGEQTLRVPYLYKSHITNNYIARPNQGKNVVKIHCRGYDDITPETTGYSEKFVFSANYMDLQNGYSWGDTIAENGKTATKIGDSFILSGSGGTSPGGEHVRNVIFENNFTKSGLGSPADNALFISIGCPNATIRNNILDYSLGDRISSVTANYAYIQLHFATVNSSTSEQTTGVRFYNNTLYSNIYNAETAQFINITPPGGLPDVDNLVIQNNLWYLPNHIPAGSGVRGALKIAAGAVPTNVTQTFNTDTVAGGGATTSPNFAAAPPVALSDWRPSGYPVNTGATVPVLRDFNNASRYGATYDLGAVLP